MKVKKIDPLHPGEVLRKEFLEPMGLSQNQLAIALRVSARRINEIVLEKRRITANTALRLARYFKMSPNSGLDFKWTMSWTWRRISSRVKLLMKSNRWLHRIE